MTKEELRKSLDFVNEERERLQRENDEYKSRIEKAVEYIEWSNYEMVNDNKKFFNYLDKLLNILRGEL